MSNPFKPNDKSHITNGIGFVGFMLMLVGWGAASDGGVWLIPIGAIMMIPAFDGWFRD